MGGRFGQLLIFGAILLAVLLDLLARRGKRTRERAGPAEVAEMPTLGEADEEEEESEWLEPGPVELRFPPRPPPPPAALMAPTSAPPPLPPRPPHPPPGIHRRRRLARWRWHLADARRGIVLMAVLGPCRGLDPPSGTNR